MSILETFYILFKSNSDDAKRKNEELDASHEKLASSMHETASASEEVGNRFLEMAGEAAAAIGVVSSLGSLLESFFKTQDKVLELHRLSEAIGVNIEDLSAWGQAVDTLGEESGDFNQDVKRLTLDLQSVGIMPHSRLLVFFQKLGVSATDAHGHIKGVMEILPELAEKFKNLSPQQALGFGERFGLSESTVILLQQGKDKILQMVAAQKALGVVTKEEGELSAKYNQQLKITDIAHQNLNLHLMMDLLPTLTDLSQRMQEIFTVFSRHSDVVIGGLYGIAAAALIAAIALGVFTSPLFLMTALAAALIGLFALLYDDFQAFEKGGDSLTGRLLDWVNKFKVFRDTIKELGQVFKLLAAFLGDVWDKLKPILEALGHLSAAFLKDVLGYDGGVNAGKDQLALAGATPLNISKNLGGSTRSNNVSIGEVNVNTQATDSAGIAGDFKLHLTSELTNATNNYDDGLDI